MSQLSLDDTVQLFQQAIVAHQAGRLDEAEAVCLSILKKDSQHFEAMNILAVLAAQRGDLQAATKYLQQVIVLSPGNVRAHNNLGNVFCEKREFDQALAQYEKAIELAPDLAKLRSNRGTVLQDMGRLKEALEDYDEALRLRPDILEFHLNRGSVLSELNQPEAAIESYNQALLLHPDDAEALSSRGYTLHALCRLAAAIDSFDQAIQTNTGRPDVYRFNKSLALLLGKNFVEGWPLFERRWKTKALAPGLKTLPQPLWLGQENISGKTMFLWHEQGFGDTFQFCRYAALLKARGATVVLEVPQNLRKVLSGLAGVDHWVSSGEAPPPFDMHCPLMSLPLAFKNFSEKDIPADIPYLFADSVLAAEWGKKLGEKKRPRVGLVWNGGFRPNQSELGRALHKRRNIPFPLIAHLNHPDIDFYSLQKGEPAESELLRIKDEYWPTDNLHIHTPDIHDFADTAALIMQLDLVIAVDTSTLHLAAALGKPVWLLNRFDTCWRWMLEGTDSPWYPTLKIYRQARYGEWDDVIERVRADLDGFVQP